MSDTINFVFVGRMEHEKGFDLIIDLLKQLFFENVIYKDKFRFFIFGAGSQKKKFLDSFDGIGDIYQGDINALLQKEYKSINYFGRQDRQLIDEVLSMSHFSLMPSRFLETFGLVGLESCVKGVNVIGFAKGGLKEFILPELDISAQKGRKDGEKIYNLIADIYKNYTLEDIKNFSDKSIKISEKFTLEIWLKKFKDSFHGKKILLVSDFLPAIGGIEVYIKNISQVLKEAGYEVEVFGRNGLFGKVNKPIKMLGIFVGLFNFVYAYLLKKKIEEFKPDLVWYHSVGRFLGRMPLYINLKGDFQKWIMYHDLGLFCPYPSKMFDEKLLKSKFNFVNFFRQMKHLNVLRSILIFFKFITCKAIFQNIKKDRMNRHLVPSDFMTQVLIDQYGLHREQITVLPHFYKK